MKIDEMKKVVKELTDFYSVFQEEVLDMFPEDTAEITPLLSKAMREIYLSKDITSSVLARRLSISGPNTSRCLQQLGNLKYIIKVKDERDKRITHIRLTEKGLELIEKSIRSMDELMLRRLGVLELEELVNLSEAFCTIKKLFEKIGTLNT